MKNNITRTGIPCVAFALVAVLLALFAGSLMAQNPYPDYDFKAVNADGDPPGRGRGRGRQEECICLKNGSTRPCRSSWRT